MGSGAYVTLDAPFVDVLIKYESMGPDQYELAEDELSVVGVRSGDTLSLGDRVAVVIEDVAILRRQVLAKRSSRKPCSRPWTAKRPHTRRLEAKPLADRARAFPYAGAARRLC